MLVSFGFGEGGFNLAHVVKHHGSLEVPLWHHRRHCSLVVRTGVDDIVE